MKCKNCGLEIAADFKHGTKVYYKHVATHHYFCHNAVWAIEGKIHSREYYVSRYDYHNAEYDSVQDFNELLDKYYNEV